MSKKEKKQRGKHSVLERPGLLNGMSSIIAILVGLLFGFIVLMIADAGNAVAGIVMILKGGFTNGAKGVGEVLHQAMPIIATGLSVGFAFKTGLFNIGATGQFTVGAFAALYVAYYGSAFGAAQWVVALLAATLAGALWGLIPGIFKAYLNVSEVISSIMMNYIGLYMVNFLVRQTIYDQKQNLAYAATGSAQIPKMGLDKIFYQQTGNYINVSTVHGGIFIIILVAILMYFVLNRTTFGYELRACGYNQHASRYAGINEKRKIVLSMVIAGALSGLGGGLLYLSGITGRRYNVEDTLLNEGYNGIPVALLGLSNPIGIIFAGLFIGYITIGGNNLQSLGYVSEIIDIITAVIIYFSAFSLLFKNVILKIAKRGDRSKGEAVNEALLETVGIETPDKPEEAGEEEEV